MLLKEDLEEIIGSEVSGIRLSPHSVSLEFWKNSTDSGSWILIQCPIELEIDEHIERCTDIKASNVTFIVKLMSSIVINATITELEKNLVLKFSNKYQLKLTPLKDGMESYVLHTPKGIVPIIVF